MELVIVCVPREMKERKRKRKETLTWIDSLSTLLRENYGGRFREFKEIHLFLVELPTYNDWNYPRKNRINRIKTNRISAP